MLGSLACGDWVDHLDNPKVQARGPVRGAPSNLMVGVVEHPRHKVRVVLRPSGTEPKLKLYLLLESSPCDPTELAARKTELAGLRDELVALAKAEVLERT